MDCVVSRDLARYQDQLDREAEHEARVERNALFLMRLSVKDICKNASKKNARALRALITEIAEEEVLAECAEPEPCEQALR